MEIRIPCESHEILGRGVVQYQVPFILRGLAWIPRFIGADTKYGCWFGWFSRAHFACARWFTYFLCLLFEFWKYVLGFYMGLFYLFRPVSLVVRCCVYSRLFVGVHSYGTIFHGDFVQVISALSKSTSHAFWWFFILLVERAPHRFYLIVTLLVC